MSKKLQQKQARRAAEERRRAELRRAARRRNLVTLTLALAIGAGVVGLIIHDRNQTAGASNGEPVGVARDEAGCAKIQTFKQQSRAHIPVGAQHPPYNSNPPTSGPHYASPAGPIDPGFYPDAIEPERVVHNLEHGQIVIWYRPDAPQDVIDDIQRLVEQQPDATVAVPWSKLDPRFNFALTAWVHSQSCLRVSQEVVDHFRTLYQGRSPEPVTQPFSG